MREGQPFLRVPIEGAAQVRRQNPREAGAQANKALRRAGTTAAAGAGSAVTAAAFGPLLAPVLAPLMDRQSVVAAREFVEGAATGQSKKVARTPPATPAKAGKSAAAPAAAAQRASVTIMPQDRVSAYLDAVFRQPLSLRQAQMAAGIMPAPGKPPTAKDQVYNAAALASESLYANQRAQAEKLAAAGDLEGAAALELKATETAFQRFAALLGADQSLQQLLAAQEGE